MVKKKKTKNKQAYIHSRYRCPVLFRFSVLICSGGPMILNKAIVKKKKPIFTVGIVFLRQHNFFSIFSPDFFPEVL